MVGLNIFNYLFNLVAFDKSIAAQYDKIRSERMHAANIDLHMTGQNQQNRMKAYIPGPTCSSGL